MATNSGSGSGGKITLTSDTGGIEHYFRVASHGAHRSGKNHFAFTAPDPIGGIPFDPNFYFTAEKCKRELGKQIWWPKNSKERLMQNPMLVSGMSKEDAKKHYGERMKWFEDAWWGLVENKDIRTLVLDTGSQLWDNILFRHFGRTDRDTDDKDGRNVPNLGRGPANADIVDYVNAVNGTDKHLIVIHRSGDMWRNNKPVEGEFKLIGYSGINYLVNAVIRHYKDEERHESKCRKRGECCCYGVRVEDSQANPMLNGEEIVGGQCTFQGLAMSVFPDSKEDSWL